MGISNKSNKKKREEEKPPKEMEYLKSDIASFASSIGLSSTSASGFDDSDFRKTGPLKPSQNPSPVQKEKNKKKKKKKKKMVEDKILAPPPPPTENKKPQVRERKRKPEGKILAPPPLPAKQNLPQLPLRKASLVGVWFEEAAELEAKIIGGKKRIEAKNDKEWLSLVAKKKELGERLLVQYAADFEKSSGSSSDIKLLINTQRSGTGADKVSAFSLLVAHNPVANIRALDALLGMVTKKVGKRFSLTGFDTLKELFLSSLLPDRKLKTMFQQPLNHLPESKDGYSLLLFWYWEDCLKHRYERFISALEEASRDMLPVLKDKALKTMYALLRSKSEQERRLLSALVNKLGDPENKGASNADFYLSNLLSFHPNMTAVVIDEVDSFLFRPHLGLPAKYHAVNFLSQIRLTHKGDGQKVAKRLVDVYFALFKVFISDVEAGKKMDKSKRGDKKVVSSRRDCKAESSFKPNLDMESRLLSALLTGVNRAFPFVTSNEADDVVEVQTPMLFKLVHSNNFNVGVQALMLLDKISSKNQVVSDRFYRAMYSKLLLPTAMNSSKAEMFVGLLHRAMKNDLNFKRVSAFSKRLLQIALQQPPQFACGCLFLLSEVLKARPPLWNMVLQSESKDEEFEHFKDIIEEPDDRTGAVLSKPLGSTDKPVLNENNVKNNYEHTSNSKDKVDSSEESNYDSDVGDDLLRGGCFDDAGDSMPACHIDINQPCAPSVQSSLPGGYDPRHREPSYCNADRASWWELIVLASHVHPSVATMARTLLSGANIVYNGNPLRDLSLAAFLDKFMEKKPKQTAWHGGSQIEPAKKLDTNNHLIGAEILSLTEVDVPPEDFVFHKFYMNKMNSAKKPKKKKKKATGNGAAEELFGVDGENESDEEIGGDESDEEIDDMLDSRNFPLEAEDGYDYNDLEQVANEDDEDLIGNDSDAETDLPSEDEGEDDNSDSDGPILDAGDNKRKRTRKSGRQPGASPFASLEDYDHLLKDDPPKKSKSTKKRRMSK